jgi:hypothetical protein
MDGKDEIRAGDSSDDEAQAPRGDEQDRVYEGGQEAWMYVVGPGEPRDDHDSEDEM